METTTRTPQAIVNDGIRLYDPLVLLVLLRATLAILGQHDPTVLRHLSLFGAMAEVAQVGRRLATVNAMRTVYDMSLHDAKLLLEACDEVAKADLILSLVVEPEGFARTELV